MENRGNRTAAIFGMVLITLGVLTLIGQFTGSSLLFGAGLTVLMGLLFFVGAVAGGRALSVMAIPGAVLTVVGLVQGVEYLFPALESGTYAWALLVSAVGVGMVIFGRLSGSRELERGGWGVARAGLVLFLVVGILVELIFTFTGISSGPRSLLWPVVLIATGLLTLIVRLVRLAQNGGLFGGGRHEVPDTEPVIIQPAPAQPERETLTDRDWRTERRSQRWERRSLRHTYRAERRSYDLFSPILWIGFGILWLQLALDRITLDQVMALAYLWPVLLIFAGINVLFGRRQALVTLALGLLLVSGAFYAAQNADRLGLMGRTPWMVMGINIENGRVTERVSGSGSVISETRPVGNFTQIVLTGGGEVSLIQGSTTGLVIESDDNLLPYLTSEVRDGELRLGVKPGVGISPTRLRYTITVKDLRSLSVNGAAAVKVGQLSGSELDINISGYGTIALPDVQVDALSIRLSGSGSVTAAGRADQLNVQISGAGGFTGPDLHSQQADVHISGVGQATVWVTDSLTSNIGGIGSVSYYGSPSVHKTNGGLGIVRSIGDK